MNKNAQYRLRIAPSPTGYPHIGTIYQALFNYAYAMKHDGSFIIRIEDTDRIRFVKDAEDVIYTSLDWFGLRENESPRFGGDYGPYRQSERLAIYHTYVQELLDKNLAYYAYYPKQDSGKKKDYSHGNVSQQQSNRDSSNSPRSIEEMIKSGDWIIRMKVPQNQNISFKDEIRGVITFKSSQITEQVLLKSDGFPTYHLAVVVDDHLMHITHVVRAEEWISSTPKHVLLYDYFGWERPKFYHTPDLRNPDKSKLSKRHGHTNVNWYRTEGYLPEAILNFLALLGWTHPANEEKFSLESFIKQFDLKNVRAVGPIFDLTKLTWMNQQYIQNLSDAELKKRLQTFDPSLSHVSQELLDRLMPLVKTRMQTLKDFKEQTAYFFQDVAIEEHQQYREISTELGIRFREVQVWNAETILSVLRSVLTKHTIKMPVLYTLFTGKPKGLPLPESLAILGKEKTLERLDRYV